jgi:3-oxoacyl-[acyl-carrier-protein] synthase II
MRRRVVVTGIGAVTPLGVGAETLHRDAVAGRSGLVDGVGACHAFRPADFLSTKDIRRTDRFSQLALAAAAEALRQAGWADAPPYPAERIACVVGTGVGGVTSLGAQTDLYRQRGADRVSPLLGPMMMPNAAAANLAVRYGWRGESYSVVAACAAGTQAIGAGLRMLRAGEADAVVVGAAEADVPPALCASFHNAGALSPSGKSVPFDRHRDGFLRGEGAAVLVLERADTAARRAAPVLAVVRGYGASSDAHHLTAPDPGATTAAAAVRRALADADLEPPDVRYINAHGTGTVLNDRAEAAALRTALGAALATIPISSSKSYLGHLLGAAGAVEAVAAIQALRTATAPPTVGLREPDERLGPLRHVVDAMPLTPGRAGLIALSTSFGFGGHNAALVLQAAGGPE